MRQEHWYEELTPQVFVPGRFDPNGNLFEPGVTETRIDTPTSWSVGTLYKILPGFAPFAGVSKSYLTNFNSETTQTGIFAPEVRTRIRSRREALDSGRSRRVHRRGVRRSSATTFSPKTPRQFRSRSRSTRQDSRGIDADLQIKLVPQWKILANAITQTAKLTAVPLTPSQVGNWPVGVPAHIFNIWTTYGFAIAGIDGFRVGGRPVLQRQDLRQYGQHLMDPAFDGGRCHARLLVEQNWDAQFGIKNIANVTYYTIARKRRRLMSASRGRTT